jgi:hypothetical protein
MVASAQETQEQTNHSFFHMDIFDYKYYFCDSCHFRESTHNLTLNLLGGISKNQYGLVIGTLFNTIDNKASGIQIVGLYNHVGNQGKGLAVAGFINNYKSHAGVQIAGFNHAEKMRGVQIGFRNSSLDMQGVQIGFINNYEELQTLKGIQIGVLNEGKSRFQIGLCNISENNPYSLGLVNIVKNGEMNVGLASDEIGNVIAQFLSGGRYLYGIVGLGFNATSDHLILQGGIGAHLNFSSKFRINMEVSTKYLTRTFIYVGDDDAEYEKRKKEFDFKGLNGYSLGIFPSFNFAKKIELFGGPTLNYLHTNTLDNKSLFSSKYIWKDFNSTSLRQLYIGYSVGLRYVLK